MPMTESELITALEGCSDDLDPISPITAVLMIADALELDAMRTIAKIRMGVRLDAHERLIRDLLEVSQSHDRRALRLIHRAIAADELISRLEG